MGAGAGGGGDGSGGNVSHGERQMKLRSPAHRLPPGSEQAGGLLAVHSPGVGTPVVEHTFGISSTKTTSKRSLL